VGQFSLKLNIEDHGVKPLIIQLSISDTTDTAYYDILYRVVQNKIPHQTICNIFATSGHILKIPEAI